MCFYDTSWYFLIAVETLNEMREWWCFCIVCGNKEPTLRKHIIVLHSLSAKIEDFVPVKWTFREILIRRGRGLHLQFLNKTLQTATLFHMQCIGKCSHQYSMKFELNKLGERVKGVEKPIVWFPCCVYIAFVCMRHTHGCQS